MQTYDPEIKESDNFVEFSFLLPSLLHEAKKERKIQQENEGNHEPVSIVLHDDPMILVLDNVLSPKECNEIIYFMNDYSQMRQGNYNRKKLIINCEALSSLFLDRVNEYLPKVVTSQKGSKYRLGSPEDDPKHCWLLDTINPAWRMVKGALQSKLPRHFDGSYVKTIDYRSLYTVIVYLVDSDGDTRFYRPTTADYTGTGAIDITPKQGRFVLFHQSIEHEGLINLAHEKYFMRSECMYSRGCPIATAQDKAAMEKYQQARDCFYTEVDRSERLEIEAFRISPMLEELILGI